MSNPASVVFFVHPCKLRSFGELQYAASFAAQIESAGYRPWFVTTEGVAAQLRGAKREALIFDSPATAKAMLEEIDPAMVIACEIYGVPRESAEMLRSLDVPVATIDATTMGVEIASDPFMAAQFRTDLILPEHYISFRPCPANDIGMDTESVFHGAAFPTAWRVRKGATQYRALGLDPFRKTVLLPIAPWAEYFARLTDEPFVGLNGYYDALVAMIVGALQEWRARVQLVVVSERRPRACGHGVVSIHAPGLIPFDLYEHILLSCDLVISDNIIQASIAKAVAAGTPHLVIQNLLPSMLPYPSNIFPLRQLFPADRELARVAEVAEFSDADDVREKIVAISERGYCDDRRRVLRADYVSRVSALPRFAQALERVVGPSGGRSLQRATSTGSCGPNRSIVFYIEIWFSFGEREHALGLAAHFEKAGYRPRFVVDGRVADHIRSAGYEPIVFHSPEMGVRAVREIDPLMIIGCELFNLSEQSVRGLMALAKPMATTDGTSLGLRINTDPFSHPKLTRTLVLPDRYWSFRPSPVNDPGPDEDDVFTYNPFSGAERVLKDEDIYASLGLDPERKTVMLAIAPWAVTTTSLFELSSYHPLLIDRIEAGLEASGQKVDLLVIGLQPGPRSSARRGVRTIFIEKLPYQIYDHVLRSCDAIVADNIIQTSVSKAFVMGTPHLIIQNLQESEVPFRCNIFPLKVLFPFNRDYGRSVEVAEFGDAGDIREKIVAILRDGYFDADRRDRRRDFLDRLGRLSDPSDALERILDESPRDGSLTG